MKEISDNYQSGIEEVLLNFPLGYEVFLEGFQEVFNASQKQKYTQYLKYPLDSFIKNFGESLSESKLSKKVHLPFFNPFYILDVETRELSATSFWTGLLDPKGSHEQGGLFLKSFLKLVDDKVGSSKFLEVSNSDLWEAFAEFPVTGDGGKNGRVDIYLKHVSNTAIAIEYKIKAKDQPEQIERYHSHLVDCGYSSYQVIYITPEGKKPSKQSMGDLDPKKVLCVSIKYDLVGMLKRILKENPDMHVQLKQLLGYYIEVAK